MSRRGPGKPFAKGSSPNPGGRPRAAQTTRALAREHPPAAIAALVDALGSPRERVAAATALLDRAWGKPTQHVAGDAEAGPLRIDFKWLEPDSTPAPTPTPEAAEAAVNGGGF